MEKQPDYLVLVNGEHRLPDGFEDTIELVRADTAEGKQYRIEKRTYEAFLRLRQDLLENDGLQIELISVYRTVATQQEIWEYDEKKYGLEYTRRFVAVPGHSEHHTGFGIDVSIVVDGKVVHGMENLQNIDHLFQRVQKRRECSQATISSPLRAQPSRELHSPISTRFYAVRRVQPSP